MRCKDCWEHIDSSKKPCCDIGGKCESDATDKETMHGMCIHCGAEMFKEGGFWWHHEQEEIPIDERGTVHTGI